MTQATNLTIRVSIGELARIKQVAKGFGVTPSQLVRDALNARYGLKLETRRVGAPDGNNHNPLGAGAKRKK